MHELESQLVPAARPADPLGCACTAEGRRLASQTRKDRSLWRFHNIEQWGGVGVSPSFDLQKFFGVVRHQKTMTPCGCGSGISVRLTFGREMESDRPFLIRYSRSATPSARTLTRFLYMCDHSTTHLPFENSGVNSQKPRRIRPPSTR